MQDASQEQLQSASLRAAEITGLLEAAYERWSDLEGRAGTT